MYCLSLFLPSAALKRISSSSSCDRGEKKQVRCRRVIVQEDQQVNYTAIAFDEQVSRLAKPLESWGGSESMLTADWLVRLRCGIVSVVRCYGCGVRVFAGTRAGDWLIETGTERVKDFYSHERLPLRSLDLRSI